MSVQSTAIHSSLSFSFFRVQISRCRGRLARHSGTSPSTVRAKIQIWLLSENRILMPVTLADNKVLIVSLGGLTPLIRQMLSPNVEVQCNAVGCITNLATHEENKAKIARSGALGPLTRLAKSRDMRVQRNATGALLNMTHSGTFCYQTPCSIFAL